MKGFRTGPGTCDNRVAIYAVVKIVRNCAFSRLTAQPNQIVVTVWVTDEVEDVVTDDACGLPPVTVRSGLANLADRAERRGGHLTAVAAESGTEIRWSVPLPH